MDTDTCHTFVVGSCLGRGGFGEVYRAKMTRPDGEKIDVALKILRSDISSSDQAVRRMRDEARLLSAIEHPAIPRVYDLTSLDGRVCLVMEYVEGCDLSRCLEGSNPMGLRALLQTLSAVADALDAAYNRPGPRGQALRIVHRDVKPSNIRISSTGEVKLLDFGIARTDTLTREARTGTDAVVGSSPYMGPERFLQGDPDPASDVFALGAILCEGIVGKRLFSMPFAVQAAHAISPSNYEAHVANSLTRAVLHLPGGPAGLAQGVITLIRHLVAFDPTERPSAAEAARLLEELAKRAEGPRLRRWIQQHDWGAPELGDLPEGPLVEGRALTTSSGGMTFSLGEGLTRLEPAEFAQTGRPRRTRGLLLVGLTAAVVGALATAGAGVLLADSPDPALLPPPVSPQVSTVAAGEDAEAALAGQGAPLPDGPVERPAPRLQPAPEVSPAKLSTTEPSTSTAPQPRVGARPPEPEARPVIQPDPPVEAQTATAWAPADSTPLHLVGAGGGRSVALQPGGRVQIPAGRWVVHADWGRSWPRSADGDHVIVVQAGDVRRVGCNKQMGRCSSDEQ